MELYKNTDVQEIKIKETKEEESLKEALKSTFKE